MECEATMQDWETTSDYDVRLGDNFNFIYNYCQTLECKATMRDWETRLGDKLRNVRLRWYGHVKRKEEDYVGKRMMEMTVPGRRKRGRPRRRWMDLVREDMERVGAREGDEVDQVKWRLMSHCGDPK